jgi:mono/diheme cytochrome c family protein
MDKKINSIFLETSVPAERTTAGWLIFHSTCSACHGADGGGIINIAPPLRGSQYIEGPSERLAMIILNGLEGPIQINGVTYKFNGNMPNFGNNFSDKQIADTIDYLQNSFVPDPPKSISITPEKIKALRDKHPGTLTEADLLKTPIHSIN